MLLPVADGEVVNVDIAAGKLDVGALYCPGHAVDEDLGGLHRHMGSLAVMVVDKELGGRCQRTAQMLFAAMVVEGNVGIETVVGCGGIQGKVKGLVVVLHLLHAHVGKDGVALSGYPEVDVPVVAVFVLDAWDDAGEVDEIGFFIYMAADVHGRVDVNVDICELLNPVAAVDVDREVEITLMV